MSEVARGYQNKLLDNVLRFNVELTDFFVLDSIPSCPNCPREMSKIFLKKPIIRTFLIKNMGSQRTFIEKITFENFKCESQGFKILKCKNFSLSSKEEIKIRIQFIPPFVTRYKRKQILIFNNNAISTYNLEVKIPYPIIKDSMDVISYKQRELFLVIKTVISLFVSLLFSVSLY